VHAKESTELCPKRRRKEQQKENTRGREQNAPHTHPAVVSSRVKLPQSRGEGREEEHAKEKKKKNTRIISRDDSSSRRRRREERLWERKQREREREREAHRKATKLALIFILLKKISPLFLQKLCVLLGEAHTRTNQNLSPISTAQPEFHASSSLSTLRRKKPIKSSGIWSARVRLPR